MSIYETPPDSVESAGHIQCYCPVLQLPRIVIHHGIWRELMFSIRKSSTELNDASDPRWHFPSALKTLWMSDMILKFFFIALNTKTDCTLQILPTEIVNKNMERINLHLPPRSWPDHKVEQKKEEQLRYHILTRTLIHPRRGRKQTLVNKEYWH